MNTNDTIIMFLVLLAVLCQVFIVGILAMRVAAVFSSGAKNLFKQITDTLAPVALPFAFVVALVTMLGSLYLSEVKHFAPCTLCWYQRICLYPLVPILGLAVWRRDNSVWRYAITLCIIDIPISIYHYLVEWFPELETSACASSGVPCTLRYIQEFTYQTTPFMALTAAVTIGILMLFTASNSKTKPDLQINP